MTITRDEVRELAAAFVTNFTAHLPYGEEQAKLSALGVDEGILRDILDAHCLRCEADVDGMDKAEYNATVAEATAEIVETAADALGELMEG